MSCNVILATHAGQAMGFCFIILGSGRLVGYLYFSSRSISISHSTAPPQTSYVSLSHYFLPVLTALVNRNHSVTWHTHVHNTSTCTRYTHASTSCLEFRYCVTVNRYPTIIILTSANSWYAHSKQICCFLLILMLAV